MYNKEWIKLSLIILCLSTLFPPLPIEYNNRIYHKVLWTSHWPCCIRQSQGHATNAHTHTHTHTHAHTHTYIVLTTDTWSATNIAQRICSICHTIKHNLTHTCLSFVCIQLTSASHGQTHTLTLVMDIHVPTTHHKFTSHGTILTSCERESISRNARNGPVPTHNLFLTKTKQRMGWVTSGSGVGTVISSGFKMSQIPALATANIGKEKPLGQN